MSHPLKIPGHVFRVGGSVRDELLGIESVDSHNGRSDCDWVVTGSTPEAMEQAGLKRVGKAFPVFLDPETGDQYALARTETKTGRGHQAFEFRFDPNVELAEDLKRRDLTINAMAIDPEGKLIDPFGGRRDLEAKVLRHVSDAFTEDPLRLFRVARFSATMPEFEVAPETLELLSSMRDELSELSAERVWQEYAKAMSGLTPFRFFETLSESSALDPWFSGLAVISLVSLLRELWLRDTNAMAAVAWLHDENTSVSLMRRLRAPGQVIRLTRDVARHGHSLSGYTSLNPDEILVLLEKSNALRPGQAFGRLVDSVQACSSIDLGELVELVEEIRKVRVFNVPQDEYGWRLRKARLEAISEHFSDLSDADEPST